MNSQYIITPDNKNGNKIVCLHDNCNSVILQANMGSFLEVELPSKYPNKIENEKVKCWKVEQAMDFDNIAFSKTKDNIKFLACADCDKGPIGFQNINDKASLLFVDKVKYDE